MGGEYIKKIRKERNMSQRRLSSKSGVSNAEISRIESGNRKQPSIQSIIRITSALDIDTKTFLKEFFPSSHKELCKLKEWGDSSKLKNEHVDFNQNILGSVAPTIFKAGFTISSSSDLHGNGMVAKKDGITWVLASINAIESKSLCEQIRTIYGVFAYCSEQAISKGSLITNNEAIFNECLSFNPINLKSTTSIILVDTDELKIIREYIFQ